MSTVPFGRVMFTNVLPAVVLTLILSIMVAFISIVSETLKIVPCVGCILVTFGGVLSTMRNVCVSVEFRLSEVSFASILKVYVPTWLVLV